MQEDKSQDCDCPSAAAADAKGNRVKTSGPAISVHYGLLDQHIPTKARHQHRPHHIVQRAEPKDPDRDHAVQIVRELVVHALARGRWHVRRNHQVQVGEKEKDGDGEGGADPGGPVGEARFMGEVDPDEAGGYEDVDDRKGIGNEAFDGLVAASFQRGA